METVYSHLLQNLDTIILERLRQIRLHEHTNQALQIAMFLREKMVEEWNNNAAHYQGFITEDLTSVSSQYLDSTQFSGDAGDFMVLTLANILGVPITIFTSVTNMPVLCILPTTSTLVSTEQPQMTYQDTMIMLSRWTKQSRKKNKGQVHMWS